MNNFDYFIIFFYVFIRQNLMVIHITIIMKTDIMIMIPMSLKCLKLLRNFCYISEMLLMKEWFMKCKICMKTRMFILIY